MKLTLFPIVCAALFAAEPSALESRKANVRGLLQRGEFAAAAEQAKALNRDRPDDIAGYQLMAAAELALGRYDAAEKAIQWMLDLRIGQADANGWLQVAVLREATGDVDGAVEAVNLAYARVTPGQQPDARSLLVYAARLQMSSGRLASADKVLADALQLAPGEETTLAALAELRMAQRRPAESAAILRAWVKPGSHPRYWYQLAEASGKPEDYAAFERSALERTGQPDNADRELALYYSGSGQRAAEAVRVARRAAAERRDLFTLDALAMALHASKNEREARDVMNQVLSVGTRDPGILKHAAQMGLQPE